MRGIEQRKAPRKRSGVAWSEALANIICSPAGCKNCDKTVMIFQNNFYVHFFVSTKKRTKESDPKRCFCLLTFIFYLFSFKCFRRFGRPAPHSVLQQVCLLIFLGRRWKAPRKRSPKAFGVALSETLAKGCPAP